MLSMNSALNLRSFTAKFVHNTILLSSLGFVFGGLSIAIEIIIDMC